MSYDWASAYLKQNRVRVAQEQAWYWMSLCLGSRVRQVKKGAVEVYIPYPSLLSGGSCRIVSDELEPLLPSSFPVGADDEASSFFFASSSKGLGSGRLGGMMMMVPLDVYALLG